MNEVSDIKWGTGGFVKVFLTSFINDAFIYKSYSLQSDSELEKNQIETKEIKLIIFDCCVNEFNCEYEIPSLWVKKMYCLWIGAKEYL